MPSLDMYKRINKSPLTSGQSRKLDSDMIMESTWWEDIASRVGYLYDWYHDGHQTQLNNLDPVNDSKKIPIDIKYIVASSQTYMKDAVTYHLQLRPSQKCNVPYYKESFENRYYTFFPIGLYIDIQDYQGAWNRWLIVAGANGNDPQFPTFEILRCDQVIQYIYKGLKYNVPAVLRSQNSYNSGVWQDYKLETSEDQQKFIVPLNRDTENIYYNQRMIIDAGVLSEPRAWRVTKVNRVSPTGLCNVTLAQDHYDEHKDYIELDSNGNVIGMWADYYSSSILPEDPEEKRRQAAICGEITHSGTLHQIKSGGGYKKFSVNFYNNQFGESEFYPGSWSFTIEGLDASSLVTTLMPNADNDIYQNQIKVKFIGGDSYLGKVLKVIYTTDSGIRTTLDIEVVAL